MSAEQTPDIEALAVNICSHSGRHTTGDGDHDAEQWGPCSQCRHYARVVAPVLAAAVREARAAELREAADFISATSGIGKSSNDFGQGWYGALEYAIGELRDRADRIAVDAPEGGA